MKTRLLLLSIGVALGIALVSAGAASAQFPRSRGPANPRYFPDLYKGPGWGMTLSEYYTFGNKADGSFGYAQHGYREGSNDDILRWKQATGTDLPPGYYLQRRRAWRDERSIGPGAPRTIPPMPPQERIAPGDSNAVSQGAVSASSGASTPRPSTQSSRRNAQLRGLATEKSPQAEDFPSTEQSNPFDAGVLNFPRNDSTNRTARDDKY